MPPPRNPWKRKIWLARLRTSHQGHRHSAETKAKIKASSVGKHSGPRPDMIGDGNPMRRTEVSTRRRKTGAVSYDAMHSRLETDRGLASTHDCIIGCGRQARDWCLIHGREQAVGGSHNCPYSFDINDYVPLCRSCHRRYDVFGTVVLP